MTQSQSTVAPVLSAFSFHVAGAGNRNVLPFELGRVKDCGGGGHCLFYALMDRLEEGIYTPLPSFEF